MDGNEQQLKDRTRVARAEASAWIVKLHGPGRTPQLEAGFRSWLSASAENARQFERVTEVWDAGTLPIAGIPRMAPRTRRHIEPRRWQFAAVMASVAMVCFGTWLANRVWLSPHYTTAFGEQRNFLLSDGSRVTLNSDSSLVVSYRHNQRRIDVRHGEAFFDVAPDRTRPFRVRAGNRQIEALGTAFDVRRDPEHLEVTLFEGKVAVSNLQNKAAPPDATLEPGQRLRVADATQKPVIDRPRMDAVAAWRRGEVIMDATPLSEAIVEMNRYDARRLVINDPTIGAVRISGVYHLGDSELFAAMVAKLYGFNVQHRDGRIYLVQRSETFTAEK